LIYDDEMDKYKAEFFIEHFEKNGILFKQCNDVLYHYIEKDGCYKPIKQNEERACINQYISPKVRRVINTAITDEVIKRIKSNPDLKIEQTDFNRDQYLINVKNGVLNVKTYKLEEHSPNYCFNYVLNVEFKEGMRLEDCPILKIFYETSLDGNKEKLKLLLQLIGYSCSNITSGKVAFFLIGPPHSGKSLVISLLGEIVGIDNYSSLYLHQLSDRFAIAKLSEVRVNLASEIRNTKIKNLQTFKSITGNDFIEAEFKGKDMFKFRAQARLIFAGNSLPFISEEEVTSAFVDRLVVLRFIKSIPKEKWDTELLNKLIAEKNIIFSLAVLTLNELINNNYQFAKPQDCQAFLDDYRDELETADSFIENCCVLDPDSKVHKNILYAAYVKYCNDNCVSNCYDSDVFSKKIEGREGIEKTRFRQNGNPLAGFKGIGFKLNHSNEDLD